jgi:hypothetical protein
LNNPSVNLNLLFQHLPCLAIQVEVVAKECRQTKSQNCHKYDNNQPSVFQFFHWSISFHFINATFAASTNAFNPFDIVSSDISKESETSW